MRVNGGSQPDTLRVENHPLKEGLLIVRLTENVEQTEEGYAYDEYVYEIPGYPGIEADILANLRNWLDQAKIEEENRKPTDARFDEARTEREALQDVSSIAFVTLAEAGSIDDVTASEHSNLFAEWAFPVAYTVNQLRTDPEDGALYRCVQPHTSQEDWPPRLTPSLWARAADPAEEWPEWSQPIGAFDAYMSGDKVSHNGLHWTSDCDNNIWEPGVYGWTQA